jgi:DNA recombination protein RmuC
MDSLRKQLADSIQKNTDAMNTQLNNITGTLMNSQKTVSERLDNAAKVVGEVHKELGSLSKASEQIFNVGKDIAGLQEILRAPKLRGSLGELFLGDLLGQILPSANFTLQHKFKSGEIVDAAIRLGAGIVPVDSKFPLENFKRVIETTDEAEQKTARKQFARDVKKHIDAIASKYILPDEGTFDFALMYIPAENVYYETIIKDENCDDASLSAYALSKRVIPVSPNSLFAYLQAIVLGLRGLRIEKSAQEIIAHLARLKGDFGRFTEEFDTLGKHITNVKNRYDDAAKRLEKFDNKLQSSGDDQLPASACQPDQKELNV